MSSAQQAGPIALRIAGEPVPRSRSRSSLASGHYAPARARAYRELIRAEWLAAGGRSLGAAPLSISARFYGAGAWASLGDLVEAAVHALDGLAFTDAAQLVCVAGAHKLPADGRGARTEVDLWAARRTA